MTDNDTFLAYLRQVFEIAEAEAPLIQNIYHAESVLALPLTGE